MSSSQNSPDHDSACQVDQPEERVFIAFKSWRDPFKCFNPAEESFNRSPCLVKLWIEPEWSPSLWISPRSSVYRDIALDLSFPVVLPNLLGIVGCISGDDRRLIGNPWNLKCIYRWLIETGIMDVCRGNRAGERKTIPIDQSTQLNPVHLFITIITRGSPFFAGISLVSVEQCSRSIFRISYPDWRRSRKIAWYTPFSQSSR